MANEEKQTLIFDVKLVKIEWSDATHRFITRIGFINYDSANWWSCDDVQGQIIDTGSVVEKSGEITNIDIAMQVTPFINGKLNTGDFAGVKVTIHDGYRLANNGFSLKSSAVYRISEAEQNGKTVKFILVPEGLYKILSKPTPLMYSSESQARLTALTDRGFKSISSAVVPIDGAGGSIGQPVVNFGNRYAQQSF